MLIGALAAVAALILLMLAADSEPVMPPSSEHDKRILQLDREAIEAAYVEHIKKLWGIWVTDYSEEPPRAVKGARQGRSAYIRAMQALEKRQH